MCVHLCSAPQPVKWQTWGDSDSKCQLSVCVCRWCRRRAGTDRPLGPQGWTWWALLCRTLQWGRYITPFLSFSFTSPPCSPLNIFSFSTPLRHKQNITQHLSNIPPLWWQLRFKRHTDNDVMHLWICDTLPHTRSSSSSSWGYWWQFLVFQLWQWNTVHANSPLW